LADENMSLVSIVKINRDNMKGAIEESLNLLGYSFDRSLHNIVIKINTCYYWDKTTGQTTDPAFVAGLIDLLREKISPDINITLIESDASAMKCRHAFKFLGYEKLAQTHKVKLVNLSEAKGDDTSVMCGGQTYRFVVPKIIKNADLTINLPKIKYTMSGIELTCALKNIFGCNPYPQKFKYHPHLGEVIVAINKAMKFDLCLIDGNIVSGIQPCKLGLVMASQDSVAIDAAAAKIAGLNPRKIKYLRLADREGLGSLNFTPRGLPIKLFQAMYPKKTISKKLMEKAYVLVIWLRLGKRLGLE
jgi:uncharacterized protein (DUF362 family)